METRAQRARRDEQQPPEVPLLPDLPADDLDNSDNSASSSSSDTVDEEIVMAAVPPLVVPPAAPVALTPFGNNVVLDLDVAASIKFYNKGMEPLTHKYDGKPESVLLFLESVSDRSDKYGWEQILSIPDDTGVVRNLIEHYGLLTMENVRTHGAPYRQIIGRNTQNSKMMYNFLIDSLETEFKSKVLLHKAEYTDARFKDGPLLLKKVIMLTYMDTRATTAHIQNALINMGAHFKSLNGDVTSFNDWVNGQVGTLRARGQDAPQLVNFLWNTYKTAPDYNFVSYINDLWNNYIDGRSDPTSDQLMHLAENKYKERVQSGEWKKLSESQEEIVALTATINALKSGKKSRISSGSSDNKTKDKESKNKESKMNERPKWLMEPPTGSESKEENVAVKFVNKKKYYFCPNHNDNKGQWVRHKPSDCKNKTSDSSEQQVNISAFDTEESDED